MNEMIICPKCGSINEDKSAKCKSCLFVFEDKNIKDLINSKNTETENDWPSDEWKDWNLM